MIKLTDATIEDLEAELERRKKAAATVPPKLPTRDWSGLEALIDDHIAERMKGERGIKDLGQYCKQEAIEAIFGKDIWNWWNEVICR
jgi:hypothetical protein